MNRSPGKFYETENINLMNKKNLMLLILLLCGLSTFAQGPPINPDYKNSLEFLQGNGVYESGMMVFLKGLKDSV